MLSPRCGRRRQRRLAARPSIMVCLAGQPWSRCSGRARQGRGSVDAVPAAIASTTTLPRPAQPVPPTTRPAGTAATTTATTATRGRQGDHHHDAPPAAHGPTVHHRRPVRRQNPCSARHGRPGSVGVDTTALQSGHRRSPSRNSTRTPSRCAACVRSRPGPSSGPPGSSPRPSRPTPAYTSLDQRREARRPVPLRQRSEPRHGQPGRRERTGLRHRLRRHDDHAQRHPGHRGATTPAELRSRPWPQPSKAQKRRTRRATAAAGRGGR